MTQEQLQKESKTKLNDGLQLVLNLPTRENLIAFQNQVVFACGQAVKHTAPNYGVYDCSDFVLQQ